MDKDLILDEIKLLGNEFKAMCESSLTEDITEVSHGVPNQYEGNYKLRCKNNRYLDIFDFFF